MSIYVCIDDTDNIDSIGTGEVADRIKTAIEVEMGLVCTLTTRHQLLIHEDIPYTSHNSSMCFIVEGGGAEDADRIVEIATKIILGSMAEESDPGLCVVCDPGEEAVDRLCSFGVAAKTQVISKEEAYRLAKSLDVHLSEHGGTGDGIIGALAGVGLRLSGNDGEAKGGLKDLDKGRFAVESLLERPDVDRVYDIVKSEPVETGWVTFEKRSKSILRDGEFTLLVQELSEGYEAVSKRLVRQMESGLDFDDSVDEAFESCHKFESDVPEEQVDGEFICLNCRHRRWEAGGIRCLKGL